MARSGRCFSAPRRCWPSSTLTPAGATATSRSPALVDLYGGRGFDVLCITDHVTRSDDPWLAPDDPARGVTAETFSSYLAEIRREARRAHERFGLLVVPGLELSWNDVDLDRAAHAVALGTTSFVSLDDGIERALRTAATAGAAVIAAHPFDDEPCESPERRTRRFACDPSLRTLAHRFELFNRTTLFGWVARSGLPVVASGDFHRPEHLEGWKTMIPCARNEASVVAYLRSRRPVYLTHLREKALPIAA